MKKVSAFFYFLLMNIHVLMSQTPCAFLNEVSESPFPTKRQPVGFAFSPLIGTDTLYAAASTIFDSGQNIDVYTVNTNTGLFVHIDSPATGDEMAAVAFSPLVSNNLFAASPSLTGGNVFSYQVDTVTGVFSTVSGSPFPSGNVPVDIAFSPIVSGKLFAAVTNQNGSDISVYEVNVNDGVFTAVGQYGSGATSTPLSIAFSPLVGTKLFAAAAISNLNVIATYSVDTVTGAFTAINLSVPAGVAPTGIAFSPLVGTHLFAAAANFNDNTISVYSVDTTTGIFTPTFTINTGTQPRTVTFSPLINGELFAAVSNFGDNNVGLYSVDTTTGNFTPVPSSPFASGSGPFKVAFSPLIGKDLYLGVNNVSDSTITVYALNLGPTSDNSTLNACAGDPVSGELNASSSPGTTITSYNIVASPAHGTLMLTSTTGIFTYTADVDYIGSDSFTFTVTDSNGCTSNIGTISIVVSARPSADDDSFFACTQQPLLGILRATAFGGATIVSYSLEIPPAHGTVELNPNTGAFTYKSHNGFIGDDQFVFSALDSNGCKSNFAIIQITINGVRALNSLITTCGNSEVSSFLQASSSGGTITSFEIINPPQHGSVNITSISGTFTYTPKTGFSGTDTFTFTASDTNGCTSDPAVVTIVVFTLPTLAVSANPQAIVIGQSSILTVIVQGGTAPYQIIWSDGFIQTDILDSAYRTVIPQDITSYSAVVMDARGCRSGPSNKVTVFVLKGSTLSNAIFLKYCSCNKHNRK